MPHFVGGAVVIPSYQTSGIESWYPLMTLNYRINLYKYCRHEYPGFTWYADVSNFPDRLFPHCSLVSQILYLFIFFYPLCTLSCIACNEHDDRAFFSLFPFVKGGSYTWNSQYIPLSSSDVDLSQSVTLFVCTEKPTALSERLHSGVLEREHFLLVHNKFNHCWQARSQLRGTSRIPTGAHGSQRACWHLQDVYYHRIGHPQENMAIWGKCLEKKGGIQVLSDIVGCAWLVLPCS